MSNTSIQLKKSGATGNTPTGLAYGEVAINYADGKLYYKNALGGTSYISNQFSFDTINANNSLILATGVSDTLSFVAGNNISISTNTTTKTITINSTGVSDTYARDTANAAFIQANAAFLKANTPDSFIFNGTSNLYFSSANGSIVANVDGNTIAIVTNTGIQMAGAEGDLSGANNIYANTVIAANGIIVSGLNVVPYLQSAFTTANTPSHVSNSAALYANASFIQANAAFIHANAAFNAANTGGSGSGNASFIFSGTSNVYFSSANGSIVANVDGNTIATVTNTGIQMAGVEGDISGANTVYANTIVANTNVTISGLNVVPYLQSAFTTANTPSHVANSAALYANAAFVQANAAFIKANTGASASYIFNGTSNVYFETANGNIVANVGGNTIATVSTTGIQISGAEGDLSGANNVYANTFIANTSLTVAGLNVVPYLQSAFTAANTPSYVANSAALYANGAFAQANAAFDKANTYPGNSNQVLYKNSSNVLTSSSGLVYDGVSIKVNGNLESTFQNGDEGGEIFLNKSVTNTTLSTGVSIDVYQNKLRIFETGGSNRGVYIDMANGAAGGIGTNLLSPAGGAVTSVAGATGTVSNTQLIAGIQTVSSSYGITFDYVATANNGQGTNFKVGDDAWIGDYNTADSLKIKGQQNAANGYVSFGSNTSQLGAAGSGQLTYGGNIVWHAGNDGAGSGLDADLLDGLNSSEFARVSAESYANSAYTQANTATNNAAGASLYANGAFIQANAAFNRANSVLGGFRSNTLVVANSTGFLSNSNAEFSSANNTLYVPNANISNEVIANSLVFYDGTRLNSATGITANTAATANVSIYAKITNVTTGVYFPIVTDTTVTGSDTFHYSSNDFLMYAANNTFRASGNVWAGQFLAVGTNIPVVNSTGHWVGQTVNGIDSFARTTANAALPTTGGTVTGNLTLSTTATMIIQNTRPTTSNSTGALIVRGGVGIAGNLFVGGIFTVDGDFQVGNTTSTGNVFNSGFVTFSQSTQFTSNAATTSNTTGAIIATGGIATRGNLFSGAIRITGPTSNGLTFADGTIQYTANATSSSIANGSSNIAIQTTNGNIVSTVNGVIITTVSNNGIQLSSSNADITGANTIYASRIVANTTLTVSGAGGDITGANNIFANVINVTTASIVSGINVVPYIQSAFIQANAAFAAANSGGGGDGTDNVARDTANAAFIQANAAFAAANSANLSIYSNFYTANGNTSTFNLNTSPQDKEYTIVNIDGVIQLKNSYSLSGNTIILSENVSTNSSVEITVLGGSGGGGGGGSATVGFVTQNKTVIDSNVTIGAGYSGVSVGPLSIANNVVINIAAGQKWVIL